MDARLYVINCWFAKNAYIAHLVGDLKELGYKVHFTKEEPWKLYVDLPDSDAAARKMQKAAFERCRVDYIERLV